MRRDVGGTRDGGWRVIEAGLNEAAVGLALWAEYLAASGATVIAAGGLKCLGAPGDGGPDCVGAGSGAGRPANMIEMALGGG